MDRRRRVVDVRDGTRRRHGLQVLVVHAVLGDVGRQGLPVRLGRDLDRGGCEQLTALVRGGSPLLVNVLAEELARRVRGVLEALEALPALARDHARGLDGLEQDRHEVHVREVQRLLGPVVHVLARQVPVQVHLAQANRVAHRVAARD